MAEHTPGDEKNALNGTFVSCTGTTITIECDDHDTKEIVVDILTQALDAAGVIEDLIAALGEVISSFETLGVDGWSEAPHLMNICRAAITKAEGRT